MLIPVKRLGANGIERVFYGVFYALALRASAVAV
jgi:hypothetical protein